MSLLTERIQGAYAEHSGWGYTLRRPQVPVRLRGIPDLVPVAPLDGRGMSNCTTFTVYALLRCYPWAFTQWPRFYEDVQIFDGARPFSPIEAVVGAQIGVEVAIADLPEGRWALGQSWSKLSEAGHVVEGSWGHARLVRKLPRERLRVLECSLTRGGMMDTTVPVSRVRSWGTLTRFGQLAEVEVRTPPART